MTIPPPIHTNPLTLASVLWVAEATSRGLQLPEWVYEMCERVRRHPREQSPPRVTAWDSANRPSAN